MPLSRALRSARSATAALPGAPLVGTERLRRAGSSPHRGGRPASAYRLPLTQISDSCHRDGHLHHDTYNDMSRNNILV